VEYSYEVFGVLDVLVVSGSNSFQRSAVGICNHLPSKSAADELRSGVGSGRAQAVEEYGLTQGRFRSVFWKAGIDTFFVGT
jgi:hypothetical protein